MTTASAAVASKLRLETNPKPPQALSPGPWSPSAAFLQHLTAGSSLREAEAAAA